MYILHACSRSAVLKYVFICVSATPQQALLQTMAAMHAKAQELTGVEVPKFYNQAAINPLKFAEQQQKRKLLWSKASQNTEQSLQKFQVSTNIPPIYIVCYTM